MSKRTDPNQAPSLKSLALGHIEALALALQKADPHLTFEASVAAAARSKEGYQAYNLMMTAGSELPVFAAINQIVKSQLAKAEGGAGSMRAAILAKRALTKGGSGPLGSMIEDPVTSGPRAPASTLPPPATGNKNPQITPSITPADALYAKLRADAVSAAPKGTSEVAAIAEFLGTKPGQALHAQWNAARQAGK